MPNNDNDILYSSARLCMRRWRPEDATDLYRYASDPRVSELALWPRHTDEEMSRQVIMQYFMPDADTYAVTLRDSGEVIGCIGLVPAGGEHHAVEQHEREAGYWIGYPHWGRGLATEALEAMITYYRHTTDLMSLLITTDARNTASQRVALKCGFSQVGSYRYEDIDSLVFRLQMRKC